jgi:hypothetical protein
MSNKKNTIILLHATSHALRAEKLLAMKGVVSRLIPVPRQLSSDCGVCIRISQADKAAAMTILDENKIETEGVHDL